MSAEGANLEQANPDETLRQKDPAPTKLWKIPLRDTDGVNPSWDNLSGHITEARDVFRAPF